MSRDPLRAATVAAVVLLVGWLGTPLFAETHIYDGITKEQLGGFAERQGWIADVQSGNDVIMRVGDQRIYVMMMDCDSDGLCWSGLIRDQTYYFIKDPDGGCNLWHWNMEVKGATGFGPSYVTLQRYLNFRGVTDQYLKDTITTYVSAAPSFWKLVEECSRPDR